MSKFSFVALIACAVAYVLCSHSAAAQVIGRGLLKNPTYPGKCVVNSNLIMSVGQVAKAPNHPCASITCLEGSTVELHTCKAKAPPKGCKLRDFVNTNLNFPECCDRRYDCDKLI
ncbi:hypothetical protein AWZ03_010450 [Drosophila navojoa]|uniref:Single domain-containing protein n=1 Tax=Drosophila navojoa TaxID=7232 RepID=A0A484B3A8_DRONA|nr:uncharacterized protein LOC108656311 [Drosophila navojoa]TDG43129.1 hypothetical protein AWZ03_010450 [Drosophila navojoa]